MKRLYIIVEGQTEEEFVNEVLAPYLQETYEIYDVRPIKIRTSKTSKGGFVNFEHLKNDALRYLKSETNIVVTTFVDFFRMPTNMPSFEECMSKQVPIDSIECLEAAMESSISYSNFVAYIQQYEFEALLYSDNTGFEELYEEAIYEETQKIVDAYDNPEEINTHPETAPSKRIIRIMEKAGEKYNKVSDGNMIALEIGIEKVLEFSSTTAATPYYKSSRKAEHFQAFQISSVLCKIVN